MAFLGSGVIGYNPGFKYELYGDQTDGAGVHRTMRVTVKLKVNGNYGFHGFWGNYRIKVKDSWDGGWTQFKGNVSWSTSDAWREFSKFVDVNVGTTSATTVPITLYIDAGDSDNSCDGSASHSMSFSSTNTAPVLSGSMNLATTIIPENQSSIAMSGWSYSDTENNINGMKIERFINGSYNTTFNVAAATSFTDSSIGAFGEGTRFFYQIWVKDSAGAQSSGLTSNYGEKNTLLGPTLASSSTIGWNNSYFDISWTAASNKLNVSDKTINYNITTTNGIVIHNNSFTGGTSKRISLVDSATSGPYILKSDLKRVFGTVDYVGSLNLVLRATNAYGSSKTSPKSIPVDLRVAPSVPSSITIDANSSAFVTAYDASTGKSNKYCVPDTGRVVTVKWGASSDYLGGSIVYELFLKIGNGSYERIANDTSALSYSYALAKVGEATTATFKIVAKTAYGYTSERVGTAQAIYHYEPPTLTVTPIERGDTSAKITLWVNSNSSLPIVNYGAGTWTCTNGQSGNLATSTSSQSINITGLTGSATYEVTVNYTDTSGISGYKAEKISIGANIPMVFINRYGLGVGGGKADSYYKLMINGGTRSTMLDCNDLIASSVNTRSLTAQTGISISEGELYSGGGVRTAGGLIVNQLATLGQDVNIGGNVDIRGSHRVGGQYESGIGYYHFDKGCLVTTNIARNTSTMFEFYITGNGYGSGYPINIILNGYTYNNGLTHVAMKCYSYSIPIKVFFNSANKLCIWFKQSGNFTTFRIKLCTSTGTSKPEYTATNAVEPKGQAAEIWPAMVTSYDNRNSTVVIESKTSNTGGFLRFSDGTQMCWGVYTQKTYPTTSWHGEFYGYTTGNYPVAFIAPPAVSIGLGSGELLKPAFSTNMTTTGFTVYAVNARSVAEVTPIVHYTATGRWR